jgi:hypothetical protein
MVDFVGGDLASRAVKLSDSFRLSTPHMTPSAAELVDPTARRLWHCSCFYQPWVGVMLKISIVDTRTQRRLVIEGKLVSPWVSEVQSARERALAGLNGRELLIDVRNLTAINQEGENLFCQLMREGVKVRCSGVFTKHVFAQLSRRSKGKDGSKK